MLTPSFVSHTCELGPSTPKVGVDALPIRQVKCDSPEHLLQAEGGERFGDALPFRGKGKTVPQDLFEPSQYPWPNVRGHLPPGINPHTHEMGVFPIRHFAPSELILPDAEGNSGLT